MMMMISALVFVSAMMAASMTLWLTVAPQWRRVLRLASGQVEQPCYLSERRAGRRIVVRSWAPVPVPAPIRRLHAA